MYPFLAVFLGGLGSKGGLGPQVDLQITAPPRASPFHPILAPPVAPILFCTVGSPSVAIEPHEIFCQKRPKVAIFLRFLGGHGPKRDIEIASIFPSFTSMG